MDEKLVIAAVAAHRSLYDPSHAKYKDVELRNAIWQKIASDLKMGVDACKSKWRTLRDGFTRSLRYQKDPSKARKPWRYQTEMEFVIPFIYSRESRSSVGDRDLDEESEQETQNQSSCSDGSSDRTPDSTDDSTLSVTSDSVAAISNPPAFPSVPFTGLSQSSSSSKRKFKSDEIVDRLKYRKLELDAVLKGWGQSSPKAAHCQCKTPVEDPTEAFFFSMGQSVKRLPFYLQAQVKMKVCQLVTDAEMECLDSASVR